MLAFVAVVVALGGIAASADAAAPRLGRWDGQAGSAQVVFTVEQNARGQRYVVRPVFYCGPGKFSYSETNASNSPDAWPIRATGVLTGGAGHAPFSGRFGDNRGTFTAQNGGDCPGDGTRFTARWDPAAPIVRDGLWNVSLGGNQPWYTEVNFDTLGEGSLIRSAWTLYGGPLCANFYLGPALGLLVAADGSFQTTIPGNPGFGSPTFQVSGRFLSGATAAGTFTITGPDCSGQPVAWTATLATPYSPPRSAGAATTLEPPGTTAPRERHIRYEIEVRSWIPQPKVVDPEIPSADTPANLTLPSPLTGPRAICRVPRGLSPSARRAYLRYTRITSYFKGDGHREFDGSFRVDMPLRFTWTSGRGISDFHLVGGRHVGTTHRLITQTSPPHHTYHCVQRETAPDTVGRNLTGALPYTFAAQYAVSQPLTKLARWLPISVQVVGAVQPDGTLTLNITHGYFPSGAVRVTANGRTVLTAIFNDASCLSDDQVLGIKGAARIGYGLALTRKDVFTVNPARSERLPPIRSILC